MKGTKPDVIIIDDVVKGGEDTLSMKGYYDIIKAMDVFGIYSMEATSAHDPNVLAAIKEKMGTVESIEQTEEEVQYEPKAIEIPEGHKSFSDVFGWEPKSIPDIPMAVFNADDWPESIRSRIPRVSKDYYFQPLPTEKLAFAMYVGGPILLYGETGTGKTTFPQEICARLNIPFLRASCHQRQEATEFLGTNSVINQDGVPVTEHSDTDTTLAAKHGGLLCIDEAFRSPNLMAVQSLLEVPPRLQLQDALGVTRQLEPENPFWLVLTDNSNGVGDTTGNYLTEVQDLSTLNRINTVIHFPYMSREEEEIMLKNIYPDMPELVINKVAKIAHKVRDAFIQGKIQQAFSYRESISALRNYEILGDLAASFRFAYVDRLGSECAVIFNNCYRQVMGSDV